MYTPANDHVRMLRADFGNAVTLSMHRSVAAGPPQGKRLEQLQKQTHKHIYTYTNTHTRARTQLDIKLINDRQRPSLLFRVPPGTRHYTKLKKSSVDSVRS